MFHSNDLATPLFHISLLGHGIGPSIAIDPHHLDFGEVEAGCAQQPEIDIVNGGTVPWTIGGIEFASTTEELVLVDYPAPGLLLGPGGRMPLTGLKPDPGMVVLGCIVDIPAPRYEQACDMTGGIVLDITAPGWGACLFQLAWFSTTGRDTFPLASPAAEATVQVKLNGVPMYVGWYYDPVDNAVVFEPDHIPNQGDIITVRYHIQGDC